ncbi:CDGSH iron-sulfur domain-containing protein 2 isoform X1 [Apis mellifera caucasica]|uniref:CDGSH iron-sulfur domain-containing protein 2 homologue n=1 Tax=Apis mellifera TaxID=7460 RepID=A0A7M7GMV3_APIME|nr:CDGSH iron-sulfur domain-containing protein 2 homolog isoform X1 [Apis mellifera]KAG6795327.1 CDGSH iron-sulfur domain-containing protein 2 isoform X1 [Apis mellifera caucasica]KAG9428753.1 CDGSH iron-sulfur domain-containing protein 2 isoform X1 [Apis mellifera carnica]|eukprot:XP_006557994.1 CDGSH iron-sulfur domain-containing protein 2 homolog isoform X1 [Apis mellifera]
MMPIAHLVKVTLPNYLAGLPIPDSIGGWFRLGSKKLIRDWIALIPPTALVAGIGYMSYKAFCPLARPPCGLVNLSVKKDVNKVVDSVDIEDITEKAAFCRCWRSKNWPYCDGAHGRHNEEMNDNVGPLVITRKKD